MRHRIYGKHLSRDKNERTALFRGLIRNLVLHESITTTETKAKAIKGLVDKIISDSRKNTPAARNSILSALSQVEVVKKLTEEIAPRFSERVSGFTTMVRLGRRQGDGTMMVKMSLVEGKKESGAKSPESGEKEVKKPVAKKEKTKKAKGESSR